MSKSYVMHSPPIAEDFDAMEEESRRFMRRVWAGLGLTTAATIGGSLLALRGLARHVRSRH